MKNERNERTSKRVGTIAAKVMDGLITAGNIKQSELKALAASCLTQRPDKKDKRKFPLKSLNIK